MYKTKVNLGSKEGAPLQRAAGVLLLHRDGMGGRAPTCAIYYKAARLLILALLHVHAFFHACFFCFFYHTLRMG